MTARSGEAGMGLTEVVIVVVLAGIVLAVTATYSIPWIAREEMRGAVYTVQMHLQRARVEAVALNRQVRFVLDPDNAVVQIVDLNDAGSGADDVVLTEARLPRVVAFARPDGVAPITLEPFSASRFHATFEADGSVAEGAGEIAMRGGERFSRVLLYGAGGVRAETWDGAEWKAGT